jgi:hypothetical protein
MRGGHGGARAQGGSRPAPPGRSHGAALPPVWGRAAARGAGPRPAAGASGAGSGAAAGGPAPRAAAAKKLAGGAGQGSRRRRQARRRGRRAARRPPAAIGEGGLGQRRGEGKRGRAQAPTGAAAPACRTSAGRAKARRSVATGALSNRAAPLSRPPPGCRRRRRRAAAARSPARRGRGRERETRAVRRHWLPAAATPRAPLRLSRITGAPQLPARTSAQLSHQQPTCRMSQDQ